MSPPVGGTPYPYNRTAAANYADQWVYHNQDLSVLATWPNAERHHDFFTTGGWGADVADGSTLSTGDLVYYNWSGGSSIEHVAIVVVGASGGSTPLVDSHNDDYWHVKWNYGKTARRWPVHLNDTLYNEATCGAPQSDRKEVILTSYRHGWAAGALIAGMLLLAGCATAPSQVSPAPAGTPTDSAPVSVLKEAMATPVITGYFEALGKQDFKTAYGLLSKSFQGEVGTSPDALAGNHIKAATVISVAFTTYLDPTFHKTTSPSNRAVFRVVVDLKLDGVSAWNPGENSRSVTVFLEDGQPKIDSIATGP